MSKRQLLEVTTPKYEYEISTYVGDYVKIIAFRFERSYNINNITSIELIGGCNTIASIPMVLIRACGSVIENITHTIIKFNNDLFSSDLKKGYPAFLSYWNKLRIVLKCDEYPNNYDIVVETTSEPNKKMLDGRHEFTICQFQTCLLESDVNPFIEKLYVNLMCYGFFIETYEKLPSRIILQLNAHTYFDYDKWTYKQIGTYLHKDKIGFNTGWMNEFHKYGLDQYICDDIKQHLVQQERLKIFWIPFACSRTWNDEKWVTEPTGIDMSRLDNATFRCYDCKKLKLHFMNINWLMFDRGMCGTKYAR